MIKFYGLLWGRLPVLVLLLADNKPKIRLSWMRPPRDTWKDVQFICLWGFLYMPIAFLHTGEGNEPKVSNVD